MIEAQMQRPSVEGGFRFGTGFLLAGVALAFFIGRKQAQDPPLANDTPAHPVVLGGFLGHQRLRHSNQRRGFGQGQAARPMARVKGLRMGGPRSARMGAILTKAVGDTINFQVDWAAQTTDFQNTPIKWDYSVRVSVFDVGLGDFVATVAVPPAGLSTQLAGTKRSLLTYVIPSSLDGKSLTFEAVIIAADSTPEGQPDASATSVIAKGFGDNSVRVTVSAGPSVPTADVNSVIVSRNPQLMRGGRGTMRAVHAPGRFINPVMLTQRQR